MLTISAEPVRLHLRYLRTQGVGYKSVAEASDVSPNAVQSIACGRRCYIRRATAEKLLAITSDARADCALMDAASTWAQLESLIDAGYTLKDFTYVLGYDCARKLLYAWRLRRPRILAVSAMRVERLCNLAKIGKLRR